MQAVGMKAKKASSSARAPRRLVICDPMCVLRYGHNVDAMNYFRKLLSPQFNEIICLGCEELPLDIDNAGDIIRFYQYYYRAFLQINDFEMVAEPVVDPLVADPTGALATADSRRLLTEYSLGPRDAIFFPSADFYGLLGMLEALSEREVAARPMLYVRFIGVMEHASKVYRKPLDELLRRVVMSISDGTKIQLSAETPNYADYLSSCIGQVVLVTSYPLTWEFMPFPEAPPFIVSAIGSGRSEKGFFELFSIFSKLRIQDPDLKIRFSTQTLPDKNLQDQMAYTSQLYAIPGLDLLPASIPSALLAETYRRSSVILALYDVDVYKYRGSAVLMEAASLGRPVLTYPGTGFAAQVSYYGLGRICENHDQCVAAVLDYLNTSPVSLTNAARQARARFFTDVGSAYQSWFS